MGAPWWSKATALISSITKSEQMNKMNKIEYNCVALSVTVAGDRHLVLFGKNRKQTMLLYMYFIYRWWSREWRFSPTGYWIAIDWTTLLGTYRLFCLFESGWGKIFALTLVIYLPEEHFQLLQACTVKATEHQISDEDAAFQILEDFRKAWPQRVALSSFSFLFCFTLYDLGY